MTTGQRSGTVESVKRVSDRYAPVSGQVTAVNPALTDTPENVNTKPCGTGWMIEIEATEASEVAELMSADAYTAHVAAQQAARGARRVVGPRPRRVTSWRSRGPRPPAPREPRTAPRTYALKCSRKNALARFTFAARCGRPSPSVLPSRTTGWKSPSMPA